MDVRRREDQSGLGGERGGGWRGSEPPPEKREREARRGIVLMAGGGGRKTKGGFPIRLIPTHYIYRSLHFCFPGGISWKSCPQSPLREGGEATGKPCSKLITSSLFPLPSPPSLSVLSNLPKEGPGLMEQEREAREKSQDGGGGEAAISFLPRRTHVLCSSGRRTSKKHMGAAEELK